MRVGATEIVDVQRAERVVGEALEEFMDEVDVERSDERAREGDLKLETRPAGQVEHDACQRFIERHVGVAVTTNALLVAHRAPEGLPEGDADVLDRVMRIDVQVALRRDGKVEQRVTTDLVQHMVEKRDTARKLGATGPVDRDADGNVR